MSDVDGSSSVEAPTAEPVSAPRRRKSVRVIIGAVAVVAVGVAVAGFVLSRHDEERMSGPSEALPSPIATPAQPHAVRRAATVPAGALIYGGLYLAGVRTGEVRAVDIRTGKPYWRYDRKGSIARSWALDRVAGRVVIAWSEGASAQVEMIDVRAGRIVWRQRSIAKLVERPPEPGGLVIDPATKVTAVVGQWWTVGLDGDNGQVRWKRRWPSGCEPSNNDIVDRDAPDYAQAMPGVFAVEERCGTHGDVVGYDARTGTERWKVSVAEAARGLPGAQVVVHTSVFAVMDCLSDVDGRLLALCIENYGAALIDSTGGRVVAHRYTGDPLDRKTPGAWSEVEYGAGVQVGLCTAGGDRVLCANDPATGKRLWRRPVPHGLEPHAPTVVDHGRVYLLAAEHDNSDWQLIVTELRTGKPLAHIPLPKPAGYRPPDAGFPDDVPDWAIGIIRTVTDGVIVTGDHAAESGTVDLLVQQ
jgi:outer membrane protein assembly factor BamB